MQTHAKTKSVAVNPTAQKEGLFRNANFIFLWLASAVSSFSLSVYLLAEEWYVVSGLNLISMLGIVMMVTMIPRIVFMFVGGSLSDRIERKKILFWSDFSRSLLAFVMAILVVLNLLNIWVLLFFALSFGIMDAFYWPASRSFLPFLIKEDQLTRANSVLQGTNQMLMVAGPAAGAVLIHWFSFKGAFALTAVLLLIGSFLNLAIRETTKPRTDHKKPSVFQDLRETMSYVKSEPYLLTVMGTSIVLNFVLSGPLSVGIPILVKNVLNGDSFDLSIIDGGLMFGMFIGALIPGMLNFNKKRAVLNLILIAIDGVFILLLSMVTSVWYGLGCVLLVGIFIAMPNVIGPSVSQSFIKKEQMGRVQSLMAMTGMGLLPVSFALISLLLSLGVSMTLIMTCGSILTILFVIVVLFTVKELWKVD